MPCESCNVQFTIFKHKKPCTECRRLFCVNCLEKTRKRSLCSRCVIFNKRPLTRTELQRLKAKDLIIYLQSKHIPTAGCVEKDDLVNLVLAHVDTLTAGASPSSSNSSSSMPSPGSHYENFRSYFNNLTAPQQNSNNNNNNNNHSGRGTAPPRRTSRDSGGAGGAATGNGSSGNGSSFFGNSSTENPFNILRQGCQVILENVSDKLANNFKFETSQSTSTRSSGSTPSSATSPSAAQPPRTSQRTPSAASTVHSATAAAAGAAPMRNNERDVRVPELDLSNRSSNGGAARAKLRVPLDTLRKEESGCECSDDEESKQQRTTSQSTSNLLGEPLDQLMAVPGTSGNQHRAGRRVPMSRSKGSTLSDSSEFSSFEELNAATVDRQKPNGKPTAVVEFEMGQGANGNLEDGLFSTARRVITRRRSDGCLDVGRIDGGGLGLVVSRDIPQARVEQQRKCCSRCGRKKNELQRRLKRFHDQLTALSSHDVELRQHLEAILAYLEGKRASVLSQGGEEEDESVTDPVIISQPMPRVDTVPQPPPPPTAPQDEAAAADGVEKPEPVVYKRRFVQLDDIKSSADLEEFSVKQLKEILVLNRVDFKGCCEKKELIDRVRRLLDDYHSCPSVEKLTSDDLCKICMDAPIECVLLECGHLATCTNCGKVLSECPICRQFIIRVVRFFRA